MNKGYCLLIGMLVLIAGSLHADTLYLKNGVQIDGVVSQRPDGICQVTIGERKVLYREKDIERIEKNDKTGVFNREEALQRAKVRDAELTELTGLNAEQRRMMKNLVFQLKSHKGAERKAARDKILALHQELDVYRYLAYIRPDTAHVIACQLMEIMAQIDPARTLPILGEETQHTLYSVRAKAIEILGKLRNKDFQDKIFQGLVDHNHEVRMMATYAVANIGAKNATPVVIEGLKYPDLRVSNASREVLVALWKEALPEKRPQTVDEWKAFWETHKAGVSNPLDPAKIPPLILPEDEFIEE